MVPWVFGLRSAGTPHRVFWCGKRALIWVHRMGRARFEHELGEIQAKDSPSSDISWIAEVLWHGARRPTISLTFRLSSSCGWTVGRRSFRETTRASHEERAEGSIIFDFTAAPVCRPGHDQFVHSNIVPVSIAGEKLDEQQELVAERIGTIGPNGYHSRVNNQDPLCCHAGPLGCCGSFGENPTSAQYEVGRGQGKARAPRRVHVVAKSTLPKPEGGCSSYSVPHDVAEVGSFILSEHFLGSQIPGLRGSLRESRSPTCPTDEVKSTLRVAASVIFDHGRAHCQSSKVGKLRDSVAADWV
ncbi:hypothetical protein BJ322DRAFT_1022067 [Thelephora terrestris]|uniref:Uncharacterized protein n=1 Tax=Thelephora terrestris TaxID=56493 RepID=A0A9P6HB70_9AGAM|nr:hypothetical protein BJ322DRAFT_1022067 [Thelephora terrestris]